MWDTVIRLWDRRAGEEISKKVFEAKGKCPKTIKASSSGESTDVDKEKIIKWVKKFVRK